MDIGIFGFRMENVFDWEIGIEVERWELGEEVLLKM